MGKERKFKFVGDPNTYSAKIIKGHVYEGHPLLIEYVTQYPNDWEEVFDDLPEPIEPKYYPSTLHKDTDLGYYAGLAMQAMISNPQMPSGEWRDYQELSLFIKNAVAYAAELIKQLDEKDPK